jgi:exopolysaccharide biosynthesis polyprenyl glycosylphosphotransferase
MIKENRRLFKLLRMALDLSLVTLAYYAIYLAVRLGFNPLGLNLDYHPDYHWRVPAFLAVCWIISFLASGAYEQSTRGSAAVQSFLTAFKLLGIMLVILGLGLFAFKVQYLSRKFMGSYSVTCLILLTLSKSLEARILAWLRSLGFNTRSVALVGEGQELKDAYAVFQKHPEWGYRVAGALGLDSRAKAGRGLRSLGRLADLTEVLRTRIVDELVFAAPATRGRQLRVAREAAEEAGIPLRIMLGSDFDGLLTTVEAIGAKNTLVSNPDRRNPYLRLIKRGMDFLGAALAILLLSPLLLLISLLILITMGRPVFFAQKRAGLRGRVFFLYKFRTMVPEARSLQQGLVEQNEMSGPVFKVKNDPRVTPLGRFLRRSSLDELPQFFNVLKGELSLVGPRPLPNYEARRVPAWARRRYSVLPGLTCTWQVSGRNRIGFEDWMRLDLKYIDQWSLWLDIQLILQTLPALLFSKGAY